MTELDATTQALVDFFRWTEEEERGLAANAAGRLVDLVRNLARCHAVISLPSVRTPSFNVSVAGSTVMYDRLAKSRPKRRPR